MAHAAQIAHPAAPRLRLVVAGLALGLTLAPLRARAAPTPAAPSESAAPLAEAQAEPLDEVTDVEAEPSDEAEPIDEVTDDEAEPLDEVADDEDAEPLDDAATDDDATDDDATDDADAPSTLGPTAEPLRPLQTAAWWTMFGAFTIGTTAGVLAGLAERQEDRATRLSTLFDTDTGAQPRYIDRKDEYEQYLRRGEGFAKAAIGVGVVAGVGVGAAIALFAVDAKRQRSERAPVRKRAALRLGAGGMEVRF